MIDWTCRRLLRLMDQERDHLLRGEVEAAAALLEPKIRLLEKVEAGQPSPARVQALRRAASRNESLIQAASKGIESARERIRAIRDGVGVNTYSALGHRQMISRPETTMHKRA